MSRAVDSCRFTSFQGVVVMELSVDALLAVEEEYYWQVDSFQLSSLRISLVNFQGE